MSVGHALQDVLEPCEGLDVVKLCGGDEGADDCPSDAAAVSPREQMVFASERHLSFILPMSGKLKSIIAGIRSMVAVFDANTVSSAPTAGLFTSRRHLA